MNAICAVHAVYVETRIRIKIQTATTVRIQKCRTFFTDLDRKKAQKIRKSKMYRYIRICTDNILFWTDFIQIKFWTDFPNKISEKEKIPYNLPLFIHFRLKKPIFRSE